MTAEKEYRRLCRDLGGALLIFLALLAFSSFFVGFFSFFTEDMSPLGGMILYYCVYGVCYALSFLLPVLFFRLFHGKEKPVRIMTAPVLSADHFLWIAVGIAMITALATCNARLLEPFAYGGFSEEYLGTPTAIGNAELILNLFAFAVIPAFAEEYLFRGLVLGALRPYGRDVAIIGSAVLFGAMHQNAGQFLFAVAAGLLFGYLADKTGSIFGGVLIHFVNNFLSLFESTLSERLPGVSGAFFIFGIQLFFYAVGLFALLLLVLREKRTTEAVRATGVYGLKTPPSPDQAKLPFPLRMKFFLHPTIIVFLAYCAFRMIYYLVLSVAGVLL